MKSAKHFFNWLRRSGCCIIRTGNYDVQFRELWAAYLIYCETGDDQLAYLDAIRMPCPSRSHFGEHFLSEDEIPFYEDIDAGRTIWRETLPAKLKELLRASKAYYVALESYERRRMAANIAISESALRKRIFDRDGNACLECGATENLTIDHIRPVVLGGDDADSNLQTLCKLCNSRKGGRHG